MIDLATCLTRHLGDTNNQSSCRQGQDLVVRASVTVPCSPAAEGSWEWAPGASLSRKLGQG